MDRNTNPSATKTEQIQEITLVCVNDSLPKYLWACVCVALGLKQYRVQNTHRNITVSADHSPACHDDMVLNARIVWRTAKREVWFTDFQSRNQHQGEKGGEKRHQQALQ